MFFLTNPATLLRGCDVAALFSLDYMDNKRIDIKHSQTLSFFLFNASLFAIYHNCKVSRKNRVGKKIVLMAFTKLNLSHYYIVTTSKREKKMSILDE
jgi:hypothetical protein